MMLYADCTFNDFPVVSLHNIPTYTVEFPAVIYRQCIAIIILNYQLYQLLNMYTIIRLVRY